MLPRRKAGLFHKQIACAILRGSSWDDPLIVLESGNLHSVQGSGSAWVRSASQVKSRAAMGGPLIEDTLPWNVGQPVPLLLDDLEPATNYAGSPCPHYTTLSIVKAKSKLRYLKEGFVMHISGR